MAFDVNLAMTVYKYSVAVYMNLEFVGGLGAFKLDNANAKNLHMR